MDTRAPASRSPLLKAKDGNIVAAFRLHAMLKHGGIDLDAEDLDFVDTSKSEQDQEWAKKCVADTPDTRRRGPKKSFTGLFIVMPGSLPRLLTCVYTFPKQFFLS